VAVVQEAYVQGVSTRRVDDLVQALGMNGMSKSQVSRLCQELDGEVERFRSRKLEGDYPYVWLDATFVKVRDNGRVVSMAVVIAIGVKGTGEREVLELDVGHSEDEAFWTQFLRGLVARGLRAPVLTTSDGAPGLTAALEQLFPEPLRQRCLAHKVRNIIQKVSPADQAAVKAHVQAAYYASRPETARLVAEEVVKKWKATYPSAMASFMGNFEACIAYLRCPQPPQVHPDDPPGREEHRGGAAPHEDAALALQ